MSHRKQKVKSSKVSYTYEIKYLWIRQYSQNAEIVRLNYKKNPFDSWLLIRLFYKATVIKMAWYWHKNRHTGK